MSVTLRKVSFMGRGGPRNVQSRNLKKIVKYEDKISSKLNYFRFYVLKIGSSVPEKQMINSDSSTQLVVKLLGTSTWITFSPKWGKWNEDILRKGGGRPCQ